MDRQRRAAALSALGPSRAAAHSRVVLLSVTLLAISLCGCRNRKEEARQRAQLTTALDQFKAQIGELQKQASGLRVRFDKLPEDLPGIETVRDDLHAVEEVVGVEGGRAQWLSGELDRAFASGKKEEIEKVRSAIPQGNGGIEQVILRVTHQLLPLERLAAQRRFFEALDAAKAKEVREVGERGKERPKGQPPAR
jgi:hypothetical protein